MRKLLYTDNPETIERDRQQGARLTRTVANIGGALIVIALIIIILFG